MNDSLSTIPVFIITEKWDNELSWFNCYRQRQLIESVSIVPLSMFDDRSVFESGSSRSLLRLLRPNEAHGFNLPQRFVRGAHVMVTRIDDKTAVRSLVFDSVTQNRYETIVEAEMEKFFDEIRTELARITKS